MNFLLLMFMISSLYSAYMTISFKVNYSENDLRKNDYIQAVVYSSTTLFVSIVGVFLVK